MTDKVRSIETIVEKADVEEGNAARFFGSQRAIPVHNLCTHCYSSDSPFHLLENAD